MKPNKRFKVHYTLRVHILSALSLAITGAVLMAVNVLGSNSMVQGTAQSHKKEHLFAHDPRPVAKAIQILEAKYGWVITYEDARYIDDSEIANATNEVRRDLHKFKPGEAPKVLIPKGGVLSFDYYISRDPNQLVDRIAVAQQLLRADSASGKGSRFKLERSGSVLHVIPTAMKNRCGVLVPAESVLDALITLPEEQRSGAQTVEAICAAVTVATQTKVVVGSIPLNLFHQHQDQQGAAGQKARDVLLNLVERVKKDANLSWRLLYSPGMEMYFLNIHQVPVRRDE